jgi:predicted KAP-like P-loop ATPase
MSSGQSIYVSDAPISDPAYDRFNRFWFAKRVAQTISARLDPSSLVIAIYGAWGDGKTTVLNFIGKELRSLPDIVVLSFNPWRFAVERSLLHYFFTSLAKSLESTLSTSAEEAAKKVTQYGELIQLFCSGAGDAPDTGSEGLAAIDIEEQKRGIAEILAQNQKKVVILIDDIDRLDASGMQAVFRLAKLTADFENTVYVLAFDAEMVASVIGERFTASIGRRPQAGRDFLEKIVQVPLDLPAVPAGALRKFAFESVTEALNVSKVKVTDSEAKQFIRLFHDGLEIRLKTPRMAKRFGNALAFTLAINEGEVNAVEMMLVEGIRIFYPNAYVAIKRSRDILATSGIANGVDLDRDERVQRFFSAATKGLTTAEASALNRLLAALFPRIVGRARYEPDEEAEWAKARRVTSAEYFDRYFSYALPSKDQHEDIQEFVARIRPLNA